METKIIITKDDNNFHSNLDGHGKQFPGKCHRYKGWCNPQMQWTGAFLQSQNPVWERFQKATKHSTRQIRD
jgi:hypothetical protein